MRILIPALAFSMLTFASEPPFSSEVDSLIHQGIELTFQAEFDSALSNFYLVKQLMPGHPVGPFYIAATLQSKLMHYETDLWQDAFFAYVDSTVNFADQWIHDHGEDPWIYFYRGDVINYLGLYQAKRSSILEGFRYAKKGFGDLRHAFELDTTFYDALIGIGNYKYWTGTFYKYIRFLPGIRDERRQGEAEVQEGMEKGNYSYWVGLNSLAWIKYNRKDLDASIQLFDEGANHFHYSLNWLWGLADTHKKAEHFETALGYYQRIVNTVKDDSLESGYNEVLARWKMIQCFEGLKRYGEILSQADLIQNRPVRAVMLDKAIECRAKAEDARRRAEKHLNR